MSEPVTTGGKPPLTETVEPGEQQMLDGTAARHGTDDTLPPGGLDTMATGTGTSPGEDSTESRPAPARRRVWRAIGRWIAAVTVFGALGSGVAYGITDQERTDLPGLATRHDGRWDYPELTLPALPEGAPRPFAPGNEGEVHHAHLRDLLLPAPEGAMASEGMPSIDGEWVSVEEFSRLFTEDSRAEVEERIAHDSVRSIAGRGWTMPDGTSTRVYLLHFLSDTYSSPFQTELLSDGIAQAATIRGARAAELDHSGPTRPWCRTSSGTPTTR